LSKQQTTTQKKIKKTKKMAATDKQIVLVFGATGKQGGSVVKALQNDNRFHIRAISRKKDEGKMNKLESMGVEIMKADIVSGEGLDKVFKGVYAVFLLTNSFEKVIEGNEFEYAKRLVDKASQCGVKVLVWSTSPNAQELSNGKYCVPQFSEKAKVENYIRTLQKEKHPFESVAFISLTFYYQNFNRKGFSPKKESDGSLVIKFPDVRNLTACDVNDVGAIFYQIIKDPKKYNNKEITLFGEQSNIEQYINTFERVTGQKTKLQKITPDELMQCPELHHGKQLAEMFKFMNDTPNLQSSDSIRASDVLPKVRSFADWLQESGWKGEITP